MPIDYARIASENTRKYGTDISQYGPVLLANLYSDRTHFVYELIQNAEDAGATQIEFRLFDDRLEISHDGRPFTEADVRGICGLAMGTKKGDLTQIGKFGIGFKSVYAFTSVPYIYSGTESFCIRNYVHPESASLVNLNKHETLFVLPFDHHDVTPGEAFSEIASRLRNLGLRTLLFLRHIEEIRWRIQGQGEGNYIRESTLVGLQARRIYVLSEVEGRGEEEEGWLVFARPLGEEDLRVEVAYQLAIGEDDVDRQVIPTPGAKLAAFFATDKETHLKFLIQGPYRTTPARDNIPDYEPWNKQLIRETAVLVADSIGLMKDLGFLTVSLLNILPIEADGFPETFLLRPIYEAVRDKLNGEVALLPTANGGYTTAHRAYLARGQDLIALLRPDQLVSLFDRAGRWLSAEITRDRTPRLRAYLMSELNVPEVDPERFARQLSLEFLVAQDDNWIAKFYGYLSGQKALLRTEKTRTDYRGRRIVTQEAGILWQAPIIRLSDNTHVPPFTRDGRPNAYLPGDFATSRNTIKRDLVDANVRAFLVSLGFEEFDVYAEVVEHVLTKYRQPGIRIGHKEGLEDHHKIAQALMTASKSKRDDLILKLEDLPLWVSARRSVDERHLYQLTERIYLPSPYTGDQQLEDFLDHIGVSRSVVWLDNRYLEVYSCELLAEIGCIGELHRTAEVARHILPKYASGSTETSDDEALKDAVVIVDTLETIGSRYKQSDFRKELQNRRFLRTINAATGNYHWSRPTEVYLGAAYTGSQDIERYFRGNASVYFLADFYRECLNADQLSRLGCREEIQVWYTKPSYGGHVPIESRWGYHARGLDGFDPSFRIEGLERALEAIEATASVDLASFVWQLAKQYRQTIYGTVETSTTQNFTSNRKEESEASTAGQILRESCWLPDRHGQLHVPSEIRLSDLPNVFETDSPAAKELAAKLGCRPEIDLSPLPPEERERVELALTMTDDEVAIIVRKREEQREANRKERERLASSFNFQQEVQTVFNQPQVHGPTGHSPVPTPLVDPERRRDRTREQIRDAIESEPLPVARFHRVLTKRWEAKDGYVRAFLKEQYHGRCQVCGHSFPKRDGEPYFEGLYLVRRTKADWIDRPGNVLCLCPNCCAKFLYGEVETESDIVEELQSATIDANGSGGTVRIKLKLCGEEVELTFRDRHILDLQEMLSATEPPESS